MQENKGLSILRSTLPMRVQQYRPLYKIPKKAPKIDIVPIRVTGGIGDFILSLGVAEEIQRRCGRVIVYSRWGESLQKLTDVECGFDTLKEGFDFNIGLNSMGIFHFAKNFNGFTNTEVEKLFIASRDFVSQNPWKDMADAHPYLDHFMGIEAIKRGLNRASLPYASLGLPPKPLYASKSRLNLVKGRDLLLPFFSEKHYDYITVHDGYDTLQNMTGPSTKNWSIESWKKLIKEIKKRAVDLKIIQLGSRQSRAIPGVDMDFRGMLTIEKSLSLLDGSKCHIDGESGLVHAATALGTPSVVLFGPTSLEFFGHKENINIAPVFCGGCWWLTQDWMAKCPLDYEKAECMESIKPEKVMKFVLSELNAQGINYVREY